MAQHDTNAAAADKPTQPSVNASSVPGPGEAAPGFALPDADGATVTLASLLASGPAVVVFYRGDW